MKNIAVIGSGRWGLNIIRNFASLDKLAAVCDINKTNFEKIEQNVGANIVRPLLTKNIKDIIRSKEIEGAVVATPPATHFKIARSLLLAGKDVWVEKPVALKSRDAKKLAEIAEKKGKILFAGHILLYHHAYRKLKQLVNEGYLGDINYIYARRMGFGKVRKNENVLWSLAVHDIAVILYLLGKKPARVNCLGYSYIQKNTPDVVYANMEFDAGLAANINANWINPVKERKLAVVGTEKMAVIDELDEDNPLKIYNQKVIKMPPEALKEEYFPMHKEESETFALPAGEMLKEECLHFIDCVESRKTPKTDAKSAVSVITVLEKCEASMKGNGKWVKL